MKCPRRECGKTWPPDFRWCQIDGTGLVAEVTINDPTTLVGMCTDCGAMPGFVTPDGLCNLCYQLQPTKRERQHWELSFNPCLGGVSNMGRKHKQNEDDMALARHEVNGVVYNILVVCDGVSTATNSTAASFLASNYCCNSLLSSIEEGLPIETAMLKAIKEANYAVRTRASSASTGEEDSSATTIVAAVEVQGTVTLGWAGDSRAYLLTCGSKGTEEQLTRDHSQLNVLMAGGLTEQEALKQKDSHAITRWLGMDESQLQPEIASFELPKKSILILCSDGLWNELGKQGKLLWLAQKSLRLPNAGAVEMSRYLVEYALLESGRDNITVAALITP